MTTGFEFNTVALSVSRDMLLDLGMVEPTPEEAAERHASAVAFYHERVAAWAVYEAARVQLAALTDPVSRALLDLHVPDDPEAPERCEGCDWSGYDGQPGAWPCRTVAAIAEHHGIAVPDAGLIDMGKPEPAPPEQQPWTGPFRIRDLFPQAFVNLDPMEFSR